MSDEKKKKLDFDARDVPGMFELNYDLGCAVVEALSTPHDLGLSLTYLQREIVRLEAADRARAEADAEAVRAGRPLGASGMVGVPGTVGASGDDFSKADPVDHPAHYTQGPVEVIDVIERFKLGFCLGNFVKYVLRAPHKGAELQDLKKAEWYLKRAIARERAQVLAGAEERVERAARSGERGPQGDSQCVTCGGRGGHVNGCAAAEFHKLVPSIKSGRPGTESLWTFVKSLDEGQFREFNSILTDEQRTAYAILGVLINEGVTPCSKCGAVHQYETACPKKVPCPFCDKVPCAGTYETPVGVVKKCPTKGRVL